MDRAQMRSVRFSVSNQLFFIEGLWEFSDEERTAMWLTEEDNVSIQRNTLKVVKRMRKGGEMNEAKYCTRGLEHMKTTANLEQRKINKKRVVNAVLAEQDRQLKSGIYDPAQLCRESLLASKLSRETALSLGATDAAAVGTSQAQIICCKNNCRRKGSQCRSVSTESTEQNVLISDEELSKTSKPKDDSSGRGWSLRGLAQRRFAESRSESTDSSEKMRASNRRPSFEKFMTSISTQFSQNLDAEAKHTEEVSERRHSWDTPRPPAAKVDP